MVVGQRRTNWVLSIRVHRKLRKAGIPSPLLFGWHASYLRLKSLSLSYTLTGKKFLKKLGLTSLGFNFSGYNLLTFSPLKYLDPESNPDNYGEYPLIKVYSFGLNLNF